MKKFILSILLFMLFIPFFVNAETCDTDKISISSITVDSKSDNVEELEEAISSDKIINLNLFMSEVGNNITYKIVIKNDSDEDYELDINSLDLKSDYMTYSFEADDNSNIVKANSSKNVTLRVEYKNEVPDEVFESGTYNDNKSMALKLITRDTINVPDTIKNPNTGVQSYILILFIILLISITAYVLLKKKNYTKLMILTIGTAIIIPISVSALCKIEIKIDSTITINKNKSICFEYNDTEDNNRTKTKYFNYNPGERLVDTINNYPDDFYNIMNSLSCSNGDIILRGVMHITHKNSENIESFENISSYGFEGQMMFLGTGEMYSTEDGCYKISAVCSRLS